MLHICSSVDMGDMSMRMLAVIQCIAGTWHLRDKIASFRPLPLPYKNSGVRHEQEKRNSMAKLDFLRWSWMQAVTKLEELQHAQNDVAQFPTLTNKRVMAFAPDLLPLHFDDEADFRAAVMGLSQVQPLEAS